MKFIKNLVKFSNIKPGELFIYGDVEYIRMRELCVNPYYTFNPYDKRNAVCLDDGQSTYIDTDVFVQRLNGAFVVGISGERCLHNACAERMDNN